jgi:hypothetical protein
VKDNRITQINRTMSHPNMAPFAFTINVEESALTQDKKNLTTKYTVYYFSPEDGKLKNVESFTDTHARVGAADLPAARRIIAFENGSVVVKSFALSRHQLLGLPDHHPVSARQPRRWRAMIWAIGGVECLAGTRENTFILRWMSG